jgi:hypothetical protein
VVTHVDDVPRGVPHEDHHPEHLADDAVDRAGEVAVRRVVNPQVRANHEVEDGRHPQGEMPGRPGDAAQDRPEVGGQHDQHGGGRKEQVEGVVLQIEATVLLELLDRVLIQEHESDPT